MSLRYSIIIPAYNEEKGIGRAIEETRRVFTSLGEPFEIIVVDDGSGDGTVAVSESRIRNHELRILRHGNNQGKGAAIRTGVAAAQGEIFMFLDADLATHPSEFAKCIPLLKAHDIVIGSRRVVGSSIVTSQPWHRVMAGRIFNTAIRTLLGLPFEDTQCGFKAFKVSAKPLFAELATTGWVFDVEIIARAMKRGMKIAEVPVAWTNGAVSRVKIKHFPRIMSELLDIRRRIG